MTGHRYMTFGAVTYRTQTVFGPERLPGFRQSHKTSACGRIGALVAALALAAVGSLMAAPPADTVIANDSVLTALAIVPEGDSAGTAVRRALADCLLNRSVLSVMVPAFLLAAGVKALIPAHVFLRHLGPRAPLPVAYAAAVGSGLVLSLCSCNVVPLFVSIWNSGAGTGPAFAFLYAGPTANVLGTVYLCSIMGLRIGLWRTVAAVPIALLIGLVMARLFGGGRDAVPAETAPVLVVGSNGRPAVSLLALLFLLLIVGAVPMPLPWRWATTGVVAVAVLAVAALGLERETCALWLRETVRLILRTVPILMAAVAAMALLVYRAPTGGSSGATDSNHPAATLLAAVGGVLAYAPTMTEAAFVRTVSPAIRGMGAGAVMALLLAAPGLSVPAMIGLGREIGARRVLCYVVLVVVLSTVAATVFQLGVESSLNWSKSL